MLLKDISLVISLRIFIRVIVIEGGVIGFLSIY